MQRWLLSLPKETYHPVITRVLKESISNTQHIAQLRATLTLLAMIAQQLDACPPIVFDTLIPPLLALARLPAVESKDKSYVPDPTLLSFFDYNVADLAFSTLSFLGKHGPAGLLVPTVQQHFKAHPEHLRLLAQYSLENGTLLTPVVTRPRGADDQRYLAEETKSQWNDLRNIHRIANCILKFV